VTGEDDMRAGVILPIMALRDGLLRLALAVALGTAPSCALALDFDYESGGRYRVHGAVDGLEGQRIRVLLNGRDALEVGNERFEFPTRLNGGQGYVVTVEGPPPLHTCTVEGGQGTVTNADVEVAVHCPSGDALLADLTLSAAPLAPAFAPDTMAYDARVPLGVMPPSAIVGSTTVTAVARHPGATIRIADLLTPSGTASAPRAVMLGQNPIFDVAVLGADGRTERRYAISRSDRPAQSVKIVVDPVWMAPVACVPAGVEVT
jgi:hypothetical protein